MSTHFNLTCEYIHCFGKHTVNVGFVDQEKEAVAWKEKMRESSKKPSLSRDDPIRTCPVVRCPLKTQTPRYDFQAIED